jgi:hypothetical protein
MAGFFGAVWLQPALVGDQPLHMGSTILVVEFVLIHAAGLMGAVATSGLTTPQRVGAVAGSLLIYLPFSALFVIFLDAWWSVHALVWLTFGKLSLSMRSDPLSADARAEMKSFWGTSVGLYVLGWILFAVIPVPELGIRAATVETAKLALGVPFVEEPQRIMAFGLFYFGLLGWAKLAGFRLEGPARP